MKLHFRSLIAALFAAAVFYAPGAEAGPYYDGKNVTIIVPNSPGGRMSLYARTMAPYLQKHLGAADVRIENRQGGGGLKGTNVLWVAEPDGLTIAFTNVPTLIMAQLANSPGVQFDSTKFTYLGRVSADPRVITVGANSGIKTIQDVMGRGKPFVFASQGTDEDFYTMVILADALGYELKIITGYEGQSDTELAVIKGDADGQMSGWGGTKAAVANGDKLPILFATNERQEVAPEVPTVFEVLKDDSKKAAVEAVVAILDTSRGFFGPPEMNADATKEMRAAITATLNDPEFLGVAQGQALEIVPASGDEIAASVSKIIAAGDDLKALLKQALESIQ